MADDTRRYNDLRIPVAKLIEIAEEQLAAAREQREAFEGAFDTRFDGAIDKLKEAVKSGQLNAGHAIVRDDTTLAVLAQFALQVASHVASLEGKELDLQTKIDFWKSANDQEVTVTEFEFGGLQTYVPEMTPDQLYDQVERDVTSRYR